MSGRQPLVRPALHQWSTCMSVVCQRRRVARVLSIVLFAIASASPAIASGPEPSPEIVSPNDNRHAAGTRDRETVTIALRAAAGQWQPEGAAGPSLAIEAFGEVGKALTVPAPLIRVNEGDADRGFDSERSRQRPGRARSLHARRLALSATRRAAATRHARCDSPAAAPERITTGRRRSARPSRFASWPAR